MPNGGSDCCGTCGFNAQNGGRDGYRWADESIPAACEIRGGLPIENPFWTYCANHPQHNPGRVRIPVGPVYVDAGGFPYHRKEWAPSPDTEEVRGALLDLVRAATPGRTRGYHAGLSLTEAAVRQLGGFGEPRALPELDRVRGFVAPPAVSEGDRQLVHFAADALARIVPPGAIAPYRTPAAVAIAEGYAATGDPTARAVLADALEEAGCTHGVALGYLRTPIPAGGRCWVVDLVRGAEPAAG